MFKELSEKVVNCRHSEPEGRRIWTGEKILRLPLHFVQGQPQDDGSRFFHRSLKSYLLILLLLFILPGCYPARQKGLIENPGSAMPEKEDPYLKDFGSIKAGEVVRYSFVIKNDSQKVLNIKDVSTSCGCTVSEVKNRILKPGDSTLVDVKFNSQGYSGEVQQFVYVSTDSLDDSLIRFIIKANVAK